MSIGTSRPQAEFGVLIFDIPKEKSAENFEVIDRELRVYEYKYLSAEKEIITAQEKDEHDRSLIQKIEQKKEETRNRLAYYDDELKQLKSGNAARASSQNNQTIDTKSEILRIESAQQEDKIFLEGLDDAEKYLSTTVFGYIRVIHLSWWEIMFKISPVNPMYVFTALLIILHFTQLVIIERRFKLSL